MKKTILQKIIFVFLFAISHSANSQSCYRAINIKYNSHPSYNWVDAYTITGCANTNVELKAVGNMYCNQKEGISVYWYNTLPNSNGSNYFAYSPEISFSLKVQTIYMRTLPTSSTSQQYVKFTVSDSPIGKPTISGTTDLCNNVTSSTYSGATNWSLTPSNAGTIVTSANTCTITWTNGYVGTVQLKGRTNATSTYCGYSPWSDDLNITLNPLPSTPTITQNGAILQSSSATGNQWYNQNGIISGETNQNYTPSISGNYYVTTTATGGCSTTSSIFNYAFLSTNSFDIHKSIKVYPNPTSSNITIDLGSNSVDTLYDVKITNTLGQEIYNGKLNRQQSTIELKPHAKSGLYIVSILDDLGTVISTNKIILN